VKGRGLAAGWIATVLVVIVALGVTITQTISLGRSGASADAERAALARQVESSRQRMQDELAAKLDVMKDMRWSAERPTAADVLRRLADLARDGHAKVSAVAPVDKEAGARSRESSHRVEMTASFHEIVDFATKVERDGGLLEDVVLETPQAKPGEESAADGLSAQFRLTTIEPSDDARQIMRRVLAASTKNPKFSLTSLALPMETQVRATPDLRDPFRFAQAPARRRHPATMTSTAVQAPPTPVVVPLTVKGIVKFPGGAAAIVNDQIVQVGDVVEGRRVEEIANGRVVVHEPGGGSRSVPLAGFSSIPPAPLMGK
jgi:hypothetical protein